MHKTECSQIYLTIPLSLKTKDFVEQLKQILDRFDIACLRLNAIKKDDDKAEKLNHIINQYRDLAHANNIPVLVTDNIHIAKINHLNGVHLETELNKIRWARRQLGKDANIGALCGLSRHKGLIAAESGADYISFNTSKAKSQNHNNETPTLALFQWWSEVIEIPVVAEAGLSLKEVEQLAPFTDFFVFGDEIWYSDNPIIELAKRIDIIEKGHALTGKSICLA
ncbi:MAG: thiamine phosphate synthase [Aestuariivita sp.]|nr:thiamine phosphate synthase [Aestuariivita sp.]